jgi:hypothetical protein
VRHLLRFFARLGLASFLLAASISVARAAGGTAMLLWTATGDDGVIGRATVYDMRYSTFPITAANFLSATPVAGVPVPQTAGSAESFTLTSLVPGTVYYVALRSGDEVPNWSLISNVVVIGSGTTAHQPSLVMLSLSPSWPNPARTSATWSYALPVAGVVVIDAFDIKGRHVRSITSEWKAASSGDVVWDLLDDGGRAVPPGVYMVRATLGGHEFTRRVVVTQ